MSEEINDPSEILLVRLARDRAKSGNYFYAVFDEEGDFVNVNIERNAKTELLSSEQSFNEQELMQLGFTKILNIKETQERGYFESKGLSLNNDCHCLIPNNIIKQKQCKKDCIKPKLVRTLRTK